MRLNRCIPSSRNWPTLNDPQDGEDDVGHNEKDNGALERPDESFRGRDTHQEQTDRHFSPHEGGKGLNPFSVGILLKFVELVLIEIGLFSSEPIVHFNNVQSEADEITYLTPCQSSQWSRKDALPLLVISSSHPNRLP